MMSAEPNYDAEMQLPEGRTCADCRHIVRCSGFGFSSPERTMCDFWPNRFADAQTQPSQAPLSEQEI